MISVILPARNEEQRLPHCLDILQTWAADVISPVEILVVCNGCTDNTEKIANAYAKRNKRIRVLLSEPGKGVAVRTGMLAALGYHRLFSDVDLSVSPDQWGPMIGKTDVMIASREGRGSHRQDETWLRHLSGRAFNLATVMLLPELRGFQDTQCGLKVFSGLAAVDIFRRCTQRGWAFDIEALYLAQRLGYSVQETPVIWINDNRSHVRLWPDAWNMLRDVWQIRKHHVLNRDQTATTA